MQKSMLLVLSLFFAVVICFDASTSQLHHTAKPPAKHCSKGCAAAPFELIHSYQGGQDGQFPQGGVIADSTGNLFGTTFGELRGAPIKHCPKSCGTSDGFGIGGVQIYGHQFGGRGDGAFPTGELHLIGNEFYGTTEQGGGTECGGLGCGTVFRFSVTGHEKAFVQFCLEPSCADGIFPHGTLIADSSGNLYGITKLGGTGDGALCANYLGGCGTVYEVAPGGAKTTLYSFCTAVRRNLCSDGAVPLGRLLLLNGNLYGTTQFGGPHAEGVIFSLIPSGGTWKETVLYAFCALADCADGAVPQAGLIADADGNLYGTTAFGGDSNSGVIFRLAPDRTLARLHSFKGLHDGALPQTELTADSFGHLYGTTLAGGFKSEVGACTHLAEGCGTVFAINIDGSSYKELHVFGLGDATDGAQPQGALLLRPDGFLYGTTRIKGDPSCSCGTLYRVGSLGILTHG